MVSKVIALLILESVDLRQGSLLSISQDKGIGRYFEKLGFF